MLFLSVVSAPAVIGQTHTTQIEQQRELFRTVHASVERGSWSEIDDLSAPDRQLLENYVLWPDLRATWLRANIETVPSTEIESFTKQYGALRPARELRYQAALNLVRNGDLAGYLRIYQQFYQGQDIAKLDCLALQAEIKAGRIQDVDIRAIDLWMVGDSQVSECDSVFEYLDDRNLLGIVEYQKRYARAVEKRNFTLAQWLAKKIDQQHVDAATQWRMAQANPSDFLKASRRRSGNRVLREQLVYATEQLTYRDPKIARKLWGRVVKKHKFSEAQKLLTAQHIALWTARDNLRGAYNLLTRLAPAAQSDEVLRWRARTSLRGGHWINLLADIAMMTDAEQKTEEWQYWQAVALNRLGQLLAAKAKFEALSLERSYYGFLAADELDQDYALDDSSLLVDEIRLKALEARPEIIRARELFYVGQDGRGRSEWDAVVRYLSNDDKIQAAILAHRWGWHSRAITVAASLGEYDDLSIRYPLPYQTTFEEYSTRANIASTWAYGIARSESLFMRDARSSAGAIGLMQLMPATGRDVAKEIKLPYSGLATLVDPKSNIHLGTTYLGQMAERYGGNRVLATAAYNAGPHRVDRWLPKDSSIDARIWIENIPFNETRQYVKRVLTAQTIFHWRMTGKIRRLSDELMLVRSSREMQRIAQR
ncbi:MAG: transglycosylase SLT domain-containing protein [Proteobacteria bacterium]|nr:transglycosylase SLT domain-containing protein [Pseudomonadota bacterium]